MAGRGRKKSAVDSLFKDVINSSAKCKKVKCKFCLTEMVKNGTRMTKHIINCKKCDEGIKCKYLNSDTSINEIKIRSEPIDCHDISESNEAEASDNSALLEKRKQQSQSCSTPAKKMCSSFEAYFGAEMKSQSGVSERPESRSRSTTLFSPQKNKINPYMDRMSDFQIVSTYTFTK